MGNNPPTHGKEGAAEGGEAGRGVVPDPEGVFLAGATVAEAETNWVEIEIGVAAGTKGVKVGGN